MDTVRRFRSDLVVLGLYLLLTFLLTWPAPVEMSSHLAGSGNDAYINPWANWWTAKALWEGHSLYFTQDLFYPYGVSLALHSFSHLNTLLWFLLRPLMGDLAAYNATVLAAYPLGAFAMFALVRYLTRSTWGAFTAGIIFAFSPYHVGESVHPVLVTTQWLPLFMLFLIKTSRHRDRRIWHASLTLFFAFLTGLSSWHLLAFAFLLATTYLAYSLLAERALWNWSLVIHLTGITIGCALLLAPLAYPIVREQLSVDDSPLVIPIQQTLSNDLLSFVWPSHYHPIWGQLVSPTHEVARLTDRRPAYLGFTAIALVWVAVRARKRQAIFWGLAGLLFAGLSLGPYVEVYGQRLNSVALPWSVPLVGFFRHPYRFNVLIQFCLAVLAGWGCSSLLERSGHRTPRKPGLITCCIVTLLILEYLSVPFPMTKLDVSPFYRQLALEEDDAAIVEFPASRQRDKEYMYYQTIHGKPIANGHVSRHSQDVYRLFYEIPVLNALQLDQPFEWSERHLAAQLAPLADRNIGYIVLHRRWIDPGELETWRDYFAFPPAFEDGQLLVFRTRTEVPSSRLQLGPQLTLSWIGIPATPLRQGDALLVTAVWTTEEAPSSDWNLGMRLQDAQGTIVQQVTVPLRPDHPTSTWPGEAAIRGQYSIQIAPHQPPGDYRLMFALSSAADAAPLSTSVQVGTVKIEPLERSFTTPPLEHRANAVFSDTLTLLGYGLQQTQDVLNITLHWQALRRMDSYKIFVHLYDTESHALVTQQDTVPHQWMYPTSWWETNEVVSDEISLPLEGIPAGTYRVSVGVYEPETLLRLPVWNGEGRPLGDHLELDQAISVP